MRLEQFEREAEEFNNENEAYIHLEKAKDSPYKLIMSGDYNTVMQGVYDIISFVSVSYEVDHKVVLQQLKKNFRINGVNKALGK